DYTGAIAYLEFCRQSEKEVKDLDLWLAFAAFHAGDYQRASDKHNAIIQQFSLIDWSGKPLKLEVNNKYDYMTLVTTESWATLIKNILIAAIKPKCIPIKLKIETVKDEINRTIISADNIKQIHYAYQQFIIIGYLLHPSYLHIE
ncbi:unnamed protein product, partial [Adineta steineri]